MRMLTMMKRNKYQAARHITQRPAYIDKWVVLRPMSRQYYRLWWAGQTARFRHCRQSWAPSRSWPAFLCRDFRWLVRPEVRTVFLWRDRDDVCRRIRRSKLTWRSFDTATHLDRLDFGQTSCPENYISASTCRLTDSPVHSYIQLLHSNYSLLP